MSQNINDLPADSPVVGAIENLSAGLVRSYLYTLASLKANGVSDEEAKPMAWSIVGRAVDFVDSGVNAKE